MIELHTEKRTTMRVPILVRLILMTLVVMAGRQAVAQTDQIQTISGARLDGKITDVSPVAVAIDVRGTQRTISVNEIKRVTFAEDPAELRAGRARILAGKYDAGLVDLQMINPAEIQRELVVRDLQYYTAFATGKLALSTGGDKAKASELMLAFVRAAPRSHHFFSAAELLGDLSVAQGEHSQAVKFYAAISTKAPWPEFTMRARLAEARAYIAQDDFSQAQQIYQSLLSEESESKQAKRQKLFAQIGLARCAAETGSPEQPITTIEDIIDQNDASDIELFGRAYNALGDCYRKSGKTQDALMAYLHVDILFYAEAEIHAEALYHLTELWDALKNPDRSVAAKRLLDERYGGSMWANK